MFRVMQSSTVLVAFAATLCAAGSAFAESWSLDDAVAHVVAEHPAVEAAEHQSEASQAVADQASSAWWPRLTFDAKYRYSGPIPELEIDTGIDFPGAPSTISRTLGVHDFASAGVTAGWRVFNFGQRAFTARAARARARAAAFDPEIRAASIAFAVRSAYLGLAFATEAEAVTSRSIETAEKAVTDAQNRLSVGLGSKLDVAAAKARLAELRARGVDATQQKHIAEQALRTLLHVDEGTPIALTDDLRTLAARAAPPETDATPQMRQLEQMEQAATLQAKGIRRSFWPTLDVFGTVDYRYPRTFVETEAGLNYAAGVSLSWLVLDGGLVGARAREASAQAATAEASQRALAEELQRSITEARTRWEAATARVAPAEEQMAAAREYLTAAQGALDAGASTTLDVQRAQDRIDAAALGVSQAYFDQASAYAAWLDAQGIAADPSTTPTEEP